MKQFNPTNHNAGHEVDDLVLGIETQPLTQADRKPTGDLFHHLIEWCVSCWQEELGAVAWDRVMRVPAALKSRS